MKVTIDKKATKPDELVCPICGCPVPDPDLTVDVLGSRGLRGPVHYIKVGSWARYVCSLECEDFFYEYGHEADLCPHKNGLTLAMERAAE